MRASLLSGSSAVRSSAVTCQRPVGSCNSLFCLVEESVNLTLHAFGGHSAPITRRWANCSRSQAPVNCGRRCKRAALPGLEMGLRTEGEKEVCAIFYVGQPRL